MSLPKILKILQSLPYIICYAGSSGNSYICVWNGGNMMIILWSLCEIENHANPCKIKVDQCPHCATERSHSFRLIVVPEAQAFPANSESWKAAVKKAEEGRNRMNDQIKVMFMLEPLASHAARFGNSPTHGTQLRITVCPGLKTCCTKHNTELRIDASQVGHGLLNVHLE